MIAYFSKHLNNFFSMPSSNTNWYKIFWEEKKKKKKKYLESSKGKLLNWDNSIHSFKYYKRGPTPITPIHVQIFPYISCSIHVSPLDHKVRGVTGSVSADRVRRAMKIVMIWGWSDRIEILACNVPPPPPHMYIIASIIHRWHCLEIQSKDPYPLIQLSCQVKQNDKCYYVYNTFITNLKC